MYAGLFHSGRGQGREVSGGGHPRPGRQVNMQTVLSFKKL